MPHQIVSQVGIKIKTSITGGKESNPLWRICLYQDGRASPVNKISLPNLPILFLSLKLNMLFYLLTNWLAYLYRRIQSPRPDVMPDRREGITRAAGFVFACIDTQAS